MLLKIEMPLWEGVLASFCAGVGVSLVSRFGLSQIKTPCEQARSASRDSDSSSSSSSDDDSGTAAAVAEVHCHHG